jgi:hypothetical protein
VKQLAIGVSSQRPVPVLQLDVEQIDEDVHVTGFEPAQDPDWHRSVWVHALPSLHAVPSGWYASAGQVADVPLHTSGKSHESRAARQSAPVFPAGCEHAPAWQLSVVHALPSSVQGVPSAFS